MSANARLKFASFFAPVEANRQRPNFDHDTAEIFEGDDNWRRDRYRGRFTETGDGSGGIDHAVFVRRKSYSQSTRLRRDADHGPGNHGLAYGSRECKESSAARHRARR